MTNTTFKIMGVILYSAITAVLAEPMIVDESLYADDLMCNHDGFLKCTNLKKEKCIKALTNTANECSPLAERRDGDKNNIEGMERFSTCYQTNIHKNLSITNEKFSECLPLLAPDWEQELREKFKDNPEILRKLEEEIFNKNK